MDFDLVKDTLKGHEGLRLSPYRCSRGKLTIGYGRNIDERGVSVLEAERLLDNDILDAVADLTALLGTVFVSALDRRQIALIDMRFQLGALGFRRFVKMVRAIWQHDWPEAARQVEDSLYFKQTTERATWVRDSLK